MGILPALIFLPACGRSQPFLRLGRRVLPHPPWYRGRRQRGRREGGTEGGRHRWTRRRSRETDRQRRSLTSESTVQDRIVSSVRKPRRRRTPRLGQKHRESGRSTGGTETRGSPVPSETDPCRNMHVVDCTRTANPPGSSVDSFPWSVDDDVVFTKEDCQNTTRGEIP